MFLAKHSLVINLSLTVSDCNALVVLVIMQLT